MFVKKGSASFLRTSGDQNHFYQSHFLCSMLEFIASTFTVLSTFQKWSLEVNEWTNTLRQCWAVEWKHLWQLEWATETFLPLIERSQISQLYRLFFQIALNTIKALKGFQIRSDSIVLIMFESTSSQRQTKSWRNTWIVLIEGVLFLNDWKKIT